MNLLSVTCWGWVSWIGDWVGAILGFRTFVNELLGLYGVELKVGLLIFENLGQPL